MSKRFGFSISILLVLNLLLLAVLGNPVPASAAGGDSFATGLLQPSPAMRQWLDQNFPVIQQVRLNDLALQRINTERQANGLSALVVSPSDLAPMGSEAVFGTLSPAGDLLTTSLAAQLPTSVDNSATPAFPPIGNQGGIGSCASWATTYYQYTYETNLALNRTASNGNTDNIFSPKWTYDMINGGSDAGSTFGDALYLEMKNGAATWADFPYDNNYLTWPTNVSTWNEALSYRAQGFGQFSTSDVPSLLTNMKTQLANGHVMVIGTFVYSWVQSTLSNDPSTAADDAFAGQKVASYCTNTNQGGHGMTVVGYNDNLWTDLNHNGVVDSGEKGAFKIANSWGPTDWNSGYRWITYDSLRTTSAVPSTSSWPTTNRASGGLIMSGNLFTLTVNSYTPTLTAQVTLNTANRGQLAVTLGLSNTSRTTPSSTWASEAVYNCGGNFGFNGTSSAVDGTFAFDFSDLARSASGTNRWYVGITGPTTIKSFKLYEGGVLVASATGLPKTANGQIWTWVEYAKGSVQPAPDFSLGALPLSQTVVAGSGADYGATITPANGFSDTVDLSVSGLPSGANGVFNPDPATGASTLSVTTSANTPKGTSILTITGIDGSLTHTANVSLVVTGLPATKLSFSAQPGASNTAGVAFGTQPVVKVQDASGNTVTTSNAAVTLAITSGTGTNGAALSGTKTVNAVNGIATFSGLSINLAGTGYTLTASSSGLTSTVSSAFNVNAAQVATKLAFTTQPIGANTAGVAFTTQPVVKIQDASGNTVTTSNAAVTLSITGGTGTDGAVLNGTKTVNAVNGIATFNGLSINLDGTGYTLTASSAGLTPANSASLDVSLLANSGFETGNPPTSWIGWGTPTYPAVARESTIKRSGLYSLKLTNSSGSNGNVGQWMESANSPSTFQGKTYTLQVWVYATVPNRVNISLWDNISGDTYSAYHPGDSQWHLLTVTKTIGSGATYFHPTPLYISSGSQISAYADDAVLTDPAPSTPTKLAFTTQPSASNTTGAAFSTQPVVKVQDANGNTVTTSNAAVTLAITSGSGTTGAVLSGTKTVNAVNGVATFSGLSINLPGTGYTLTAASAGLTSTVSNAFNLSSAVVATKLAFTTQPSDSNMVGAVFGTQPVVTVQDAGGNTVTNSSAAVTLAIASGTGASGAILSGLTTMNAVNGVATFSGLSINLDGMDYTLTAASAGLTPANSASLDVSLLANSGFETGNPPTSWIGWGTPTYPAVARESTIKRSGLYSLKLTNSSGSNGNVGQWMESANSPSTFQGKTYTLQVWVYATVSNRVNISLWDNISGDTYSAYHPGDSQWHLLTVTKTIGSGATYFHPTPLYISSGSQISAYADDAVLTDPAPSTPTKLAFTTQPSASNTTGAAFSTQPVVKVQDANGNTVTGSNGVVTLAISGGLGTSGASLSGTATVNAVNGVATFNGLSINLAGTGYTLTAASAGLTSAVSNAFNVSSSSVATKLAFTTQPNSSNTVGAAFGTQPVVTIQDAGGNTVSTSNAAVTLAITSGTGTSGAVLSGTTTINAVNGVATFSGLSINLAGTGYTLRATGSGLTSATSTALSVAAPLLSNGGFESGSPPTGWIGWGTPTYPVVARESTIKRSGSYSLKLTNAGAGSNGNVGQWMESANSPSTFQGKTYTLQVWVYATVPNRVNISLWDNISGDTYSAYHPGDSQWHLLTVTKTIGSGATYFHPTPLYISSGSQISAYADDALLMVGN